MHMSNSTFDSVVVGLGSMGSMALWRLAGRGAHVIGVEQFGIGHDFSAAGGESRQFRDCLQEPEFRGLLRSSRTLLKELERESGRRMLWETGGVTFGAPDDPLVRTIVQRADEEGVEIVVRPAGEASRDHPMLCFAPDDVVISERASGIVRPEAAIVGAVEAARTKGAGVITGRRVRELREDDDVVLVSLDDGSVIRARTAVVTAGPWAFELMPGLASGATVERVLLTWYPIVDETPFLPTVFPTWTKLLPDGVRAFGVPTFDNASVKVATIESFGVTAPDQLDRTPRIEEWTRTNYAAQNFLRGVGTHPVRTSVHMEGFTPDGQPLIGKAPSSDRIFVACGFSGKGFKMTTSVGELLAQLALDGGSDLDTAAWSPSRFAVPRVG